MRIVNPGDIEKNCSDCGDPFVFTVREQEFYKEKGYSEPKRCFKCRQLRKQQKEVKQND